MQIQNANLLRGLIREAGYSQRGFAAAVGLHNSTIFNILAGRRRTTPETARRICAPLGVELDRIFIAHDTEALSA